MNDVATPVEEFYVAEYRVLSGVPVTSERSLEGGLVMPTSENMGTIGLAQHRSWEDVVCLVLGALIVFSAQFTGMTGNRAALLSAGIAGILIAALSILEIVVLRRWEEILTFLLGCWVVISPFVLGYGGALRVWHVVLGAIVAIIAALEMWQDRGRDLQT